tara:strand:- start:297 stop:710 length:414 start_codon:yes stop_codon:yes gene_type:complete
MLTPKQHAFVLAYIENGNASESYRLAYSTDTMKERSIHQLASRLLKHQGVQTFIQERQDKLTSHSHFTLIEATRLLEETRIQAQEKGDLELVRRCIMDKARLHGLLVERKEVSTHTTTSHIEVLQAVKKRRQLQLVE